MRNQGWVASALTLIGTFSVGLTLAQSAGSTGDRGYPIEAGGANTGPASSGGVFSGMGSSASDIHVDERARNSAAADGASTAGEASGQKFKSPEAAVEAFIGALRKGDNPRLEAIFGSPGKSLLTSGDPVADRNERATFLRHFDRKHDLNPTSDGRVTLVVGESAWPFAVPIAKGSGGYYFDTAQGEKQVVFRRMSRNERNAVAVCTGFVGAQKEYARSGHDGLPTGLYAQKLRSDPGKQNGLFWTTEQGEPRSPAGPLLAGAGDQGYAADAGQSTPYHGYFYRPLGGQSEYARDGEKNYIDADGKQSGGFAMVAFPAEYGRTGVKSFIVNQDGIIYEKDLGEKTLEVARGMKVFDPKGWRTAL